MSSKQNSGFSKTCGPRCHLPKFASGWSNAVLRSLWKRSFFKSSPVAPSLIIVSQRDSHDQTWAIQSSAPMFVFLGETHTPAKRARNKGPSSCALQAKLSLSGSILDEERKIRQRVVSIVSLYRTQSQFRRFGKTKNEQCDFWPIVFLTYQVRALVFTDCLLKFLPISKPLGSVNDASRKAPDNNPTEISCLSTKHQRE